MFISKFSTLYIYFKRRINSDLIRESYALDHNGADLPTEDNNASKAAVDEEEETYGTLELRQESTRALTKKKSSKRMVKKKSSKGGLKKKKSTKKGNLTADDDGDDQYGSFLEAVVGENGETEKLYVRPGEKKQSKRNTGQYGPVDLAAASAD